MWHIFSRHTFRFTSTPFCAPLCSYPLEGALCYGHLIKILVFQYWFFCSGYDVSNHITSDGFSIYWVVIGVASLCDIVPSWFLLIRFSLYKEFGNWFYDPGSTPGGGGMKTILHSFVSTLVLASIQPPTNWVPMLSLGKNGRAKNQSPYLFLVP